MTSNLQNVQLIRLQDARFCVNCEVIHNMTICPLCVSDNQQPLASFLNRKESKQIAIHDKQIQV